MVVKRCLAKIRNRALAAAFARWAVLAATVQAQRVAVGRVLVRMRQRAVVQCFEAWQTRAANARDMSMKEFMLMKEKARREGVMRKALAKAARSRLVRAWNTWRAMYTSNKRRRELRRRCLRRMRSLQLAQCFDQWLDTLAEEKAEAQEQLRKALLCIRMLKRIRNAQLLAVLNQWVSAVAKTKHDRRTVQRCVARMQHRVAGGALLQWVECVATTRRHRVMVGRSVLKMERRAVARALEGWRVRVCGR